jgi:aminoglycoside/choline kinase family phosphotransferase
MIDTPLVLDDVTAAWMAEALGVGIDSIVLQPIGLGEGFMGQLARVHIHSTDAAAPASVIVKLPTADPGGRMIGEMTRVWEREHHFYRELAPLVGIRVPVALVNVAEPPCLVLEDLAPATPGDHVAGATLDQAERAIDTLARFHAAWFEHPLLQGLAWMPGIDDPQILSIGPMFELGWPTFLERFGDSLPQRCLRWCEQFVGGIPDWVARHADEPITLVHGDYRLDNLFFDDDGAVAVIDWQLAMRAPGQTDVVYFCANNLTVEMRREHDRALIERYVAELHRLGVPSDAVTVSSVWQGYRGGLLFYAASFGASLLTIDPSNERGVALFEALVHRTFSALDDLDVGHDFGYDDSTS